MVALASHCRQTRQRIGRDSVTDASAGHHANKASRGMSVLKQGPYKIARIHGIPETGSILTQGPCKQARQVSLVKQLVCDTDIGNV